MPKWYYDDESERNKLYTYIQKYNSDWLIPAWRLTLDAANEADIICGHSFSYPF